ncbi:MAG: L,D-transpeptidase [Patescibacteria group bacterium]|jgi:murein L,D-transpeptidase YafK
MLKIKNNYKGIVIVFFAVISVYYFYPEKALPENSTIDKILVYKAKHEMEVYSQNKLLKTYKVSLGRGGWGLEGKDWDNKTPVGNFVIDTKFTNSSFHKALTISYGNQIEIHGMRNHLGAIGKIHRLIDWTQGCIAVTNDEVDELYIAVPVNTPIYIRP